MIALKNRENLYQKFQRIWISGILTLVFGTTALSLWGVFSPLQSAATANGFLRVEGKRRVVQHYDGGVIEDLLVTEGTYVDKGTPLVIFQTNELDKKIQSLVKTYLSLSTRKYRLTAQVKSYRNIEFSEEIIGLAKSLNSLDVLEVQQKILTENQNSLKQRLAVIDSQIRQLETQISGHAHSLQSISKQIKLFEPKKYAVENLAEKKLASQQQVADVKISYSRLMENLNKVKTEHKRDTEKRQELTLSHNHLRTKEKADALEELQILQEKLPQLKEEISQLKSKRARSQLLAPISGWITNMRVNTIGATVQPGIKLLEIVPNNERLVVEAHLHPEDMNNITPGGKAKVRLTSYNIRRTPALDATVKKLSPDRLKNEQGDSYYEIILHFDNPQKTQPLYPGMPAEVIINTGKRSLADYLLAPLISGTEKAFLEQ